MRRSLAEGAVVRKRTLVTLLLVSHSMEGRNDVDKLKINKYEIDFTFLLKDSRWREKELKAQPSHVDIRLV